MPNDLTAKRNLLNSRADDAPTSQRQKLTSSGFTASIWTISGVVLVACGTVEDFLGLDDGGGGGGRSVHVQSSAVQGARIYFDADDDGTVSPEERAAQDAQYPQGFVTNENGEANGIPGDLYGKAFVAVLDGAFDADTGESLSGILRSIPNPNENGDHTLASPITEYIANQADTAADEVAELLGLPATLTEAQEQMRDTQIQAILTSANYQGGDARIETLAAYLANTQSPMQTEITRILLGDEASDNTLIVVNADTDTSSMDVIDLPPATISMADGAVLDSYVATIHAVGHGDPAEYSIVESAGSGAFTVNERGVITVRDGMTPTTTTLQIEVRSGTETEMVEVEVTVADAPVLEEVDSGLESTPVAENEAGIQGGTDLVMGISTDATSPDWVIRAPGGFSDKFDVVADGSNWKLVLKEGEMLDREAFPPNGEISLQVWAVNSGVRSEPLTLTVMVEDANDAPVFLEPTRLSNGGTDVTTGTETLSESAGRGAEVARVDAHDHDTNPDWNDVTYAITTGNTDGIFEIVEINGEGVIRVADASMLDYESGTTSYTLTITATDGLDAAGDPDPTADDTIMVTINVMDINDESPSVTPTTGTGAVRITDGTPPATATNTGYTITVTDADASNDFAVSVRGDSRFDFVRQQNSDTWDLVLLANRAIPAAELNSEITLTYTVTDGGVGTIAATGTVTLDVVDTPVSFMPTTAAARMVNEGDTGWFLQLTAQSVDETLQGAARTSPIARYEFVGDSDGFAIDESTGRITLTDAFDYEDATERTHSLTIRATDSRTPMAEMGETSITINVQDVNDNRPIFVTATPDNGLSDGTEEVDENTGTGTVFARVRAMDADGTDRYNTVTYSITAGNPGDAFAINEDTGEIRVNDGALLNYEAATFYALTITASDNQAGSMDAVQIITVNIGDINDESPTVTPTTGTGSVRITDGTPPATATNTGYTITVTDADASNDFAVSVRGDSRFDFVRQPNSDTWDLVLLANQAIPAAELNSEITLTYTVTDGGVGTTAATGTVTLDVVDTPVEFTFPTDTTIPLDENNMAGVQVTEVSASSSDADGDVYIKSYELVDDFGGLFRLAATGVQSTSSYQAIVSVTNANTLDHEGTDSYALQVRATDTNDETNILMLTVTVGDVEEGSAEYEITEGNNGALSVALVEADSTSANYSEDPDGVVGDVSYQWFKIETSGTRTDVGTDSASYTIAAGDEDLVHGVYIGYTDGFGTEYTHTDNDPATTIEVITSPIKFSQAPVDILESQGPTPFVTLTPSVDDAGTGHTFSFAYVTGTDSSLTNLFELGATSGEIKVGGTLDRDVTGGDRYVLPITITYDPDGPSSTVGKVETRNVNVVVNVGDVNDNEAEFAESTYSASVAEDATTGPAGTVVFTVEATDADATPEYSDVSYAIKGGTGMSLFDIDAETGEIRAKSGARLNFDATTSNPNPIRSYSLEIIARDGLDAMGMEALTEEDDTTTVTIRIDDVNDNAPNIVVADPSPSVTERTASANTDIITGITVTDGDSEKTYAQGDFELTGDSRFNFVWDATAKTGSVVLTSGSTIAPNTTISLSLTVTDANPVRHSGTDTETLTITVEAKPPFGATSGTTGTAMQYDPSAVDASGTLMLDTASAAQAKTNPAASEYTITDGQYGTATVDASGAWTYNVDNTHADVKALTTGSLTDTFTIGVPLTAGGTGDVDVTVTINAVAVVEGTANADTGAAPGNLVNRAAATAFEVIYGSHEDDVITVGTEGAVVFGGYGDDTINLRNGKTDIVVYRFSSIDGGSWRADDGGDIINNFERDKDIFILVDDDATPIGDLATFLSRATSPFVPSTLTAADEKPNFLGPVEGVNFSSFEFQFPAKYDVDGPGDLTKTTDPNVVINWATPVSQADAVTQGLINDNTGDGWDSGSSLITDSDNVPNWFTTDIDTHVGLVIMTSDQLAIDIL